MITHFLLPISFSNPFVNCHFEWSLMVKVREWWSRILLHSCVLISKGTHYYCSMRYTCFIPKRELVLFQISALTTDSEGRFVFFIK